MYRVMPQDPGPNGSYRGVKGVGDVTAEEPFEVVFKVPRMDGHAQDGHNTYTIVLPKYAADEIREQASEELHEHSMDAMTPGTQ